MNKDLIVNEIKRAAAANNGKPLGMQRFKKETGIRKCDWYGRHWRNWGEALAEAGFPPNEFQAAYDEKDLLSRFIELIRELGRVPVEADLRMKARQDKQYPSHSSFARLGARSERLRRVVEYCASHEGFQDVLALCPGIPVESELVSSGKGAQDDEFGFVYLMRSGRYYKVGRSNAVGRRERELAIQLPERARCVHEIRTDDPPGIEAYWHRRFADRRKNGEWFELTSEDVSAFKRQKFM